MISLDRYLTKHVIDAAWTVGPGVVLEENSSGMRVAHSSGIPPHCGELLAFTGCLHRFLRQGPVIGRPPTALCRTLANTDLPVNIKDYRQPWPILGIEWPLDLGGSGQPTLTLVWHASPGLLLVFSASRDTSEFSHAVYQGSSTLDVLIDKNPSVALDDLEVMSLRTISRMALNFGLLLTHKAHRLLKLPEEVRRNRKHRNREARLDAHQQAQPVLIRDLDMLLRWQERPVPPSDPTGTMRPPHFRWGHWNRVAYGPRHSLQKLDWIEPYWTGGGPEDGRPPIVTVLK